MKYEWIPSHNRYRADHGWLNSYHLFSFAQYYDPDNLHFGALRVFNDDTIAAKGGFGMHPHKEMEIVTIVLSGVVTHTDTMGNKTKVTAGEVQRMSAGVGVFHAEENNEDKDLKLYQIWCMPSKKGILPEYEQKKFVSVKNAFQTLVSSDDKMALSIYSPVVFERGVFDAGYKINIETLKGYGIFIYLTTGKILFDQKEVSAKDQLRIVEENIFFEVLENADFLVIKTPL